MSSPAIATRSGREASTPRRAEAPAGRAGYHHGNLRATLLALAMRRVEGRESFSLRSLAREAGVSASAPYRHFADRAALESALAVQGLGELQVHMFEGRDVPSTLQELVDLGIRYVDFAVRRPALYRLIFAGGVEGCVAEPGQRTGDLQAMLYQALEGVFPGACTSDLVTATWGLLHGLASLHVDVSGTGRHAVLERAQSALTAIVSLAG